MRLSFGSAVALAAGLLIAFAFWPENRAMRGPALVLAENKQKTAAPVHPSRVPARRSAGASTTAPSVQEHPLSSDVGQQPPIETAIEEALAQPTDFNVDPEPLKDAIGFIAQRYQIPILLDRKTLEEASIDASAEVRLPYSGLKLRQALTLLLDQVGQPMGFDIRDGVLWLSTREKIQERHFVVVYDCRDLVNLRPILPVETGRRQVQGMSLPQGSGMTGGGGCRRRGRCSTSLRRQPKRAKRRSPPQPKSPMPKVLSRL